VGTHALDVGAMTPVFWFFEEREKVNFDLICYMSNGPPPIFFESFLINNILTMKYMKCIRLIDYCTYSSSSYKKSSSVLTTDFK
jgi:hypothetical protein